MSGRSARLPEWVAEVRLSGERPGLDILSAPEDCELDRFGRRGASVALFEGYLYEPEALARRLGLAPDAANHAVLVSTAYRRWGAELFAHLDGSFVAAVWDADERTLTVGHDAFGHHPLFYRSAGNRLWFSSNVLVLAHCGRFPLRPHRLNLALNLRLARPTPGETYFEGVSRLLPGHRLERRADREARIERFWTPIPEPGEAELDPTDLLEAFEERLEASVARRMALGPDGVMLSGGLDSVCVAALAAEAVREHGLPSLVAYSARHHPDDPPSYEEEMQDRVAERLGMPQDLSDETDWLGGQRLIEASLEEVRSFPCPSIIYWTGGYMGYARYAAERGDHWFLTGSGGDDWLAVDPRYAADLIRTGSLWRLASFVRAAASGTGASYARVLRHHVWAWGLRLLLGSELARWSPRRLERRLGSSVAAESAQPWCPDAELREAIVEVGLERRVRGLGLGRDGRSFRLDHLRQLWLDSFGIHEREVAFHALRRAGTIYTSPYHDASLLEFLCRLPAHRLFRGGRHKGPIRDLVARRLPGLGLERQRKTYSAEPSSSERALEAELPEAWREIGCRRLEELGLVDASELRQGFDNRLTHGHDSRVKLYALLSTEAWIQANFERASSASRRSVETAATSPVRTTLEA